MDVASFGEVCKRTAALMDDPSQSWADDEYLRPFLQQAYEDLSNELIGLSLQFQEGKEVVDVPPYTSDLTSLIEDGSPLARMMRPTSIEWKRRGADDTQYLEADMVSALADVDSGNQAVFQWAWVGGMLEVIPSAVETTLRIRFDSMTPDVYDPSDKVLRGVTNVLAYSTAAMVLDIRGNSRLSQKYEAKALRALTSFKALCVMRSQSKVRRFRSAHSRVRPSFLGRLLNRN